MQLPTNQKIPGNNKENIYTHITRGAYLRQEVEKDDEENGNSPEPLNIRQLFLAWHVSVDILSIYLYYYLPILTSK